MILQLHMYIFLDNISLHFVFCHNHLSTHLDLFPLQNLLSQKSSIFFLVLSMPLYSCFMSQSLYFLLILETMFLFVCFCFFLFPSNIEQVSQWYHAQRQYQLQQSNKNPPSYLSTVYHVLKYQQLKHKHVLLRGTAPLQWLLTEQTVSLLTLSILCFKSQHLSSENSLCG